jgi:hypothetical protein
MGQCATCEFDRVRGPRATADQAGSLALKAPVIGFAVPPFCPHLCKTNNLAYTRRIVKLQTWESAVHCEPECCEMFPVIQAFTLSLRRCTPTPGKHFSVTSGTMVFNGGETRQTIQVPLLTFATEGEW